MDIEFGDEFVLRNRLRFLIKQAEAEMKRINDRIARCNGRDELNGLRQEWTELLGAYNQLRHIAIANGWA